MDSSDGDKLSKNTEVSGHSNQGANGKQKTFALSRVFVAVATKNNAMPLPDGNSFWVVQGKDGKPALEPIQQSLLAVPTNVVLSVSMEDCAGLLFYIRNVLMKDMSQFSGIQVNVVHTEAVYNADKGTINTEMSLYPTQYIPLSAISFGGESGGVGGSDNTDSGGTSDLPEIPSDTDEDDLSLEDLPDLPPELQGDATEVEPMSEEEAQAAVHVVEEIAQGITTEEKQAVNSVTSTKGADEDVKETEEKGSVTTE